MNSNVHPTIEKMMASIFRTPPNPCDHCGPDTCGFYPCENITDPEHGPDAIALKGAEE
jgi:hypothetical protein